VNGDEVLKKSGGQQPKVWKREMGRRKEEKVR
jgi:hypothetical protein